MIEMNKPDKITFPVRNIDAQEWNVFKFNAGKEGKSANKKMLELIDEYNNKCREE